MKITRCNSVIIIIVEMFQTAMRNRIGLQLLTKGNKTNCVIVDLLQAISSREAQLHKVMHK